MWQPGERFTKQRGTRGAESQREHEASHGGDPA